MRETENEDENWEYYVERMKDQQEEYAQDEEEGEEPRVYGDPVVKSARKALTKENAAAFKFPDRDDINSTDITNIIRVLSPPKIGRRGESTWVGRCPVTLTCKGGCRQPRAISRNLRALTPSPTLLSSPGSLSEKGS
ncbi:hypothetical protein PR048_016881 [Dryococelus australis]|uniref:Uncharacterized protein n=1 Tax=Dryococelus australis TaxID=614101 RepID=A0ABQ9H7Y1_9NEOP|nr:hypothetical protein PR048_016881 [Dryococelus australis]